MEREKVYYEKDPLPLTRELIIWVQFQRQFNHRNIADGEMIFFLPLNDPTRQAQAE